MGWLSSALVQVVVTSVVLGALKRAGILRYFRAIDVRGAALRRAQGLSSAATTSARLLTRPVRRRRVDANAIQNPTARDVFGKAVSAQLHVVVALSPCSASSYAGARC
jgi:hypothetical protein